MRALQTFVSPDPLLALPPAPLGYTPSVCAYTQKADGCPWPVMQLGGDDMAVQPAVAASGCVWSEVLGV